MTTHVPCPTCGRQVVWSNASTWRPFCSRRCQLIDLGDWLDETHRIRGPDETLPGDQSPTDWDSEQQGFGTSRD